MEGSPVHPRRRAALLFAGVAALAAVAVLGCVFLVNQVSARSPFATHFSRESRAGSGSSLGGVGRRRAGPRVAALGAMPNG